MIMIIYVHENILKQVARWNAIRLTTILLVRSISTIPAAVADPSPADAVGIALTFKVRLLTCPVWTYVRLHNYLSNVGVEFILHAW